MFSLVKGQPGRPRVVITGLGLVTPIGKEVNEFWNNLVKGVSGIGPVTLFETGDLPSRIGAEVKCWDPTAYLPPKLARETDRFIQFGLVAANKALEDSGIDLEQEERYRAGVVFGNSIGGIMTVTQEQHRLSTDPSARTRPHFIPKMLPNLAAGRLSILHGLYGPCLTVSAACASGSDAVGLAAQMLRSGRADVMVAGGAEALYCRLVYSGLCAARAMSTRNDHPEKASRPFDRLRDGMVLGEGAGVVVLETLEHAARRGARIYGELLGYGSCGDGYHVMAPEPDGRGEVYCMRQALADADLNPAQVDYINAHGTSTPLGDKVETLAIRKVFGSHAYNIPVSSIKGSIGHLMAAGGVVELIACIKALETGIIPPTLNQEERDPDCDLDYVPNYAREKQVDIAVSNSFGFGGQNASLVIGRLR